MDIISSMHFTQTSDRRVKKWPVKCLYSVRYRKMVRC